MAAKNEIKKKYGIIIVDMQEGGPDRWKRSDKNSAINALRLVVTAIPSSNRSLVLLELLNVRGMGQTYSRLEELADPAADLIIGKQGYDGFRSTDFDGDSYERNGRFTRVSLDYHLRKTLQVHDLIIGGWNTNVCVADTIESGLERKYEIHTAPDLLVPRGSPDQSPYEFLFSETQKLPFHYYKSAQQLVEALK